ncbi:hypothetical protein [Devosia nitrariae]|uniref:Uncharacterized protein n=1 Tax=Devosia nitrariae TaxID=2071872 RepID=A0ABQ5VZI4_9HYPH|nr:hypothetical protein [Devosia nitrariae]GLQ53014.1 hypothetical protein GCM10010862_02720 [Devosia nitrariae]
MTLENANPRSLALRATDGWSISEGVPERRNALETLRAVLSSWLWRPRRPPDVPAYLRADLGLPPVEEMTWEDRRMYDLILLGMAMKG